jgi:putative phosphoesterase
MLVAFISDVHANLPALDAVVEKLEKCDEVYCCGDIVGYYPYPDEVVEVLRESDVKCVMGNHDFAVVTGDFSGFNYMAEKAGKWTMVNAKEETLDFLTELPFSLKTEYFSVYHGKPGEGMEVIFEYVFPDDDLEKFVEEGCIVVGHSHIQFVRWYGKNFFLNPGSVGQPRDGDPRAAYAIFDTEKWKIELKRVNYNIDEVCEAVERENLPYYLCERLYKGF